jgi:hypothetical protein
MTQFYILEIKQLNNGEFEHNVYFAWDENPNKARLKAEAKYHEVLSAGAVSNTKKHSAIIVSEECFPVVNQCYKHESGAIE